MQHVTVRDFDQWREAARRLIAQDIPPQHIQWQDARSGQSGLFNVSADCEPEGAMPLKIPRAFIALAEKAACHRDPERFSLLYFALWRLTHGERHLLDLASDSLVHNLTQMQNSVKRDAHKAKAFVRFRLQQDEDGQDHYIAWHRPDHYIIPIVAPFFARRFSVMRWTILTPDDSVYWDGEQLHFGPGVPASEAPPADVLEALWRDYYRATFNPARIKIAMMKREMPVRHWKTLPETWIMHQMLEEAPERVQRMLKHQEGMARSAADFIPPEHDIASLRESAKGCQGCPLYAPATQTVFGVGPTDASLMLVGEQPGDQEDRAGEPFVGPAGEVLNRALDQAGVAREALYITNAVKHFKFTHKGVFREHGKPNTHEINACRPWLEAELAAIRPLLILCLGATAARSLMGHGVSVQRDRGQWRSSDYSESIAVTYHPSAILRAHSEETQNELYRHLVEDLSAANRLLKK